MGVEYFDLEQEDERIRLDLMWSSLIKGKTLTVLDEAQTWPAIFPRLRGAIDHRRSVNGRFFLLGSVSPVLMTQVSEALTGRIAQIELAPLTAPKFPPPKLEQLWRGGGFPEPYLKKPPTPPGSKVTSPSSPNATSPSGASPPPPPSPAASSK